MVKRLPTMRENQDRSLGWEDPLEKEMATHSSNLAWKIPWMEQPGVLQSMGSQRVGHDFTFTLNIMPIYHKNFVLPDFTSSSNMHLGYNMVWMFESPTNLYVEMLALTTMLLNFWEVIRPWEWSSHNEISAFTGESQESSQTLSSSEDTEKKVLFESVSYQQPNIEPAGAMILNSQPPLLWGINVCCS